MFRPDDTRVQRLAATINLQSDEEDDDSPDDDSTSERSDAESDCDEGQDRRVAMSLEPQRIPFDDLSLDAVPHSKIHISSGVICLAVSVSSSVEERSPEIMRMSATMHLPLISQFVCNVQKHQKQIDAFYEQAHQNACKRDMQRSWKMKASAP